MKRAVENRVKRLENKIMAADGIARYLRAIDGLSRGIPSHLPPISPEKQAEIDEAISLLTQEEVKILNNIGSPNRQ
ncbi:MAG: hypothetical protein HKP41_14290 [Desulfobacterales bacterium]|nr:hypothetical protein [Deltaproteobacteria bacterium]NNK95516.1 hypothetical protein [Desulfobacterales bacterium]